MRSVNHRLPAKERQMAILHTFTAKSASMNVGDCTLVGQFVLNGNVNSEGRVNIKPADPTHQIARYTGELTDPTVNIEYSSILFETLMRRLGAADSVDVRFTSASNLFSVGSQIGLETFSIYPTRKFE